MITLTLTLRRRALFWTLWLTKPSWRSKSSTRCRESSAIPSKERCTRFLRSLFHRGPSRKLRFAQPLASSGAAPNKDKNKDHHLCLCFFSPCPWHQICCTASNCWRTLGSVWFLEVVLVRKMEPITSGWIYSQINSFWNTDFLEYKYENCLDHRYSYGIDNILMNIPFLKRFAMQVIHLLQNSDSWWLSASFYKNLFIEMVFSFLRMTILPSPEKLKDLLQKVKDFHLKFLEDYSQPEPQMDRSSQEQPEWWFLHWMHYKCYFKVTAYVMLIWLFVLLKD